MAEHVAWIMGRESAGKVDQEGGSGAGIRVDSNRSRSEGRASPSMGDRGSKALEAKGIHLIDGKKKIGTCPWR
jgi:hypothetical protein